MNCERSDVKGLRERKVFRSDFLISALNTFLQCYKNHLTEDSPDLRKI